MHHRELEDAMERQRYLQEEVYGYDFESMTLKERVDFIHLMTTAGVDEAHEALNETSWKPWSKGDWINEDQFKNELVDEFHFFMNRCMAVGMSAQELFDRYFKKTAKNVRRQKEGYDVRVGKCALCKRALDDDGLRSPVSDLCLMCYEVRLR